MDGINKLTKDNWKVGEHLTAQWANDVGGSVNRLDRFGRSLDMDVMLANSTGTFYVPSAAPGLKIFNGDAVNAIPAYGVVLSNGVTSDNTPVPKVKRPDTYGCQRNFYVCDASSISASDYGIAQWGDGNLFKVAWDTTDGFTPAPGEMWGVQSGSYLIRKNYAGFRIEGVYDSTNHWALARSEPCYTIRGKPTPSQVASGQSSTLNVYVGAYGSETQPAGNPQILNVRNDSSCTIQVKISRIHYNPDNQLWAWQDAYTQ